MQKEKIEGLVVAASPLILVLSFIIYFLLRARKKSINDWEELYELEKRANNLELNLESIEAFHKEFLEKANRLRYNQFINVRLGKIDGYLRGLYKAVKNDN